MDGETGWNWNSGAGQAITEYPGLVMGGGKKWTLKQRLEAIYGHVNFEEASRRLAVKVKTNSSPKKLKRKKNREPPQSLSISLRGKQGKEYLRKRMVHARARVFLELLKKQDIAVSVWEVMRKARARKPWATSGDLPLIMEAAQKVGMDQYKKEKTLFFK